MATLCAGIILSTFAVIPVLSTGGVNIRFSHRFVLDEISTRIFRTFVDVTLNECVRQCNQTNFCTFVNYQRLTHVCSLIQHVDVNIPAQREEYPSYVSVDLSADKAVDDPCQHCSDFETCNNGSCLTIGCPPPSPSGEHLVSGNLYTTGSRLAYRCNGTNNLMTDSVSYSTCLASGGWTSFDLTCCAVDPPSAFETGNLNDGTEVTYVVIDKSVTQQAASDYCVTICARLVQITTSDRLTFFTEVMNRAGNRASDYWVDVVRSSNSNRWFTSTGDLLPAMNVVLYWNEDQSIYTCARAKRSANYRWDGASCGTKYRFICEK